MSKRLPCLQRRGRSSACFLAPGSRPLYGYGALGQAFRFAGRLNRIRNITLLEQGAIGRGGTRLELEEKTEAFSLTRALANEQ